MILLHYNTKTKKEIEFCKYGNSDIFIFLLKKKKKKKTENFEMY